MKNNILLIIIKGLTVTLIVCFWLVSLFNDFIWENMTIYILPLLVLNTASLFVTFYYRMDFSKSVFMFFLFFDILIFIFLVYYLRLFLAFEEI